MKILDIFTKRIRASTAHEDKNTVNSKVTAEGLLLAFKSGAAPEDFYSLLSSGDGIEAEEKLLRAYLSDLLMNSQCMLSADGVLIPWKSFYEITGSDEYASLIEIIDPPRFTNCKPILSNIGTLSDDEFNVFVKGWAENGKRISANTNIGPELKIDGVSKLVSSEVFALLDTIAINFGSNDGARSQKENELAWGIVREKAIAAEAVFDSAYLASTVVLTPATLKIPSKKEGTPFGRVVTVEPTFRGAPENWLKAFDEYENVQDHYNITRDGGLVKVIISEPVKKVLEVIKREIPNRKVAGRKAEMFVRNPKAYLGDYAENIIEDLTGDEASLNGVSHTSFHVVPSVVNNMINKVTIVVTEFYFDGQSQTFRCPIDSKDELFSISTKIGDYLSDRRETVPFKEFDLSLDQNTQVEFQNILNILHMWERQGQSVIKVEDIYELSDYSDRIKGIGPAKAIYVPVLQKPEKENDAGWLPEDLTPILKVMLTGTEDPIFVPLTKEWVEEFDKKVLLAETEGVDVVRDIAIPTPMDTQQARVLANGFKALLGNEELNAIPEIGSNAEKSERKNKETLLVKSNFSSISYASAYVEDRNKFLTSNRSEPILPSTLRNSIKLKKHQLEGVSWFQNLYKKSPAYVSGCLLADDMGLGKTLQLLCVLGALYESEPTADPSLIIVPKSLLQNWASEVEKFFTPSYPKTLSLYGGELNDRKQPKSLIDAQLREKGIADLLRPDWVGVYKIIITTYDVLTNFEFSFAKQGFSFVICDEAQRIKNPAANVSMAVRKLKSKFRVACTGTPVENSLVDLWCLFDFFQPGLLGALDEFYKTYRKPIECKSEDQIESLNKLKLLIAPQTLRRTKKDIASELPKKLFAITSNNSNEIVYKQKVEDNEILKVFITDNQKVLYKGGLKRLQEARNVKDGKQRGRLSFAALHFMKAVCAEPYCLPGRKFVPDSDGVNTHLRNSPKLAWLINQLEAIRLKNNGEKAIVFTEIREVQAALYYFLSERFKISPLIVNGESENRQGYIDKFSSGAGFDVIILSPLAAGAGLNVTSANHVFHFTRAWNPAKESQATDRAYRIGQERDVMVYCPTVVDPYDSSYQTFEQRLDILLKEKEKLARTTVDDEMGEMLNGSNSDVGFTEFMTAGASASSYQSRQLTIEDIDHLDGDGFEIFTSVVFTKLGYLSTVTPKNNGDGGIDVVAIKEDDGLLIQCKSSGLNSIGWDAVKEVVGGSLRYQARYPNVRFRKVAITNKYFNNSAIEQAGFNQVQLIDRENVTDYLSKLGISDLVLEEAIYQHSS